MGILRSQLVNKYVPQWPVTCLRVEIRFSLSICSALAGQLVHTSLCDQITLWICYQNESHRLLQYSSSGTSHVAMMFLSYQYNTSQKEWRYEICRLISTSLEVFWSSHTISRHRDAVLRDNVGGLVYWADVTFHLHPFYLSQHNKL